MTLSGSRRFLDNFKGLWRFMNDPKDAVDILQLIIESLSGVVVGPGGCLEVLSNLGGE